MKLRIVAGAILLMAVHGSAFANEIYKFDQSRSKIGFSVHQFLGTTNGKFTKFDGKIEIDREHPENSSVTARIDIRSIDTGIVKRDNHLRSAEFFNVEKYPLSRFQEPQRETDWRTGGRYCGRSHHARRDEANYSARQTIDVARRRQTNSLVGDDRSADAARF